MARQANLVLLRKIVNAIRHRLGRDYFKPSDKGIFDPFVPIGSLKRLENEYEANYSLNGEQTDIEETFVPKRSFLIFRALVLVVTAVIVLRLIGLQITKGQEHYSLAEGNRLRSGLISAPRGLIYDRNGVILVKNTPSFSVIYEPSYYPSNNEDREELVKNLATALGREREQLRQQIESELNKKSIVLEEDISREKSLLLEVKLKGIDGAAVVKSPRRSYEPMPSSGHVLGYVGKVTAEQLRLQEDLHPTSIVGLTGVEKIYDAELRGETGTEILEVDSKGKIIRPIGNRPPTPGKSLILTLDRNLQTRLAESLKDAVDKSQAKSGAAVVMSVATGEILAMVSLPDFDNNVFSQPGRIDQRQKLLNDETAPLFNRAISGQYPSGSTTKPLIAAAALEEGVINASTKLDTSEGKIVIGEWIFPDWKIHGVTDVRKAIAESNNIFFYALGGGYKQINGLGAERLSSYLNRFGLGSTTGIDLPGEVAGLVPTPSWKKRVKKESWYVGDTYNLAIGQGDLLLTPLQLTRAIAAIANGGKLLKPKIVKQIISNKGESIRESSNFWTLINIDEAQLKIVREGMRQTVVSGSARSFANLPIEIAAKTGTAQFNYAKNKTHSWFTAFAPYLNPEITVSVIVEGGGEGFAVAAPVARNVIEQYFGLPITPIIPASFNE